MSTAPHSLFYTSYINSADWQARREDVIRRAGFRCERCRDMAPLEVPSPAL
jgi:hypothetical protein